MAYDNGRLSTFSSVSGVGARMANPSAQVSTQTLLNALHTSYSSSQPHPLEASTSLTVNTWWTASNVGPDGRLGGTADMELARKAWEHARRRAEDACVILGSLHNGSPSMMASFVSCIPIQAPSTFYTALEVIKAFTHTVTPFNPSLPRYSTLAATFSLNLLGEITGASLSLSKSGIDTKTGLLHIPSEAGYRAFDVFYYLSVSSASQAERDFLNLRPLSAYNLTRRSGTLNPPAYVPTADDAAAAEDFRNNLKKLGIKGAAQRGLISALAGILKLGDTLDYLIDEEVLNSICDEVAPLLDISKDVLRNKLDTTEREVFIAGLYEGLVDWVIQQANQSIRQEISASKALSDESGAEEADTVNITVVDIPGESLGKAIALKTVFDDSEGINAEMREDGVPLMPVGASVLNEMNAAVKAADADLDGSGAASREIEQQRDRREGVLEKVAQHCGEQSYLRKILHPVAGQGVVLGEAGRLDLPSLLQSSRIWFQLNLLPSDESPAILANGGSHWSASSVSRQLRAWRLPEWANHRNRSLDFTADFDFDEFATRYARLGCRDGKDGIENWLVERGWCNGEVIVGAERVWIREASWWEAESMLDVAPPVEPFSDINAMHTPLETGYTVTSPNDGGFFGSTDQLTVQGSRDNLLNRHNSTYTLGNKSAFGAQSLAPTQAKTMRSISGGDYGLGRKGDTFKGEIMYEGQGDAELGDGKVVVTEKVDASRRFWVMFVWAVTFWIPSPLLRHVGRMKRPDVRMAWREKFVLILIIFFINAAIVFYIIEFGRLLCPNFDKAWNQKEVSYHQGSDDYYVSHHGKVYDLSKFWKTQHSDITGFTTTTDNMEPFGGTNVDEYIKPPLTLACPKLVTDATLQLLANTSVSNSAALHVSGPTLQTVTTSKLHDADWYTTYFLPKMNTMYKGDLVWATSDVKSQGQNQNRQWFIKDDSVYDLTDYFYTTTTLQGDSRYKFFPSTFEDLVQGNAGLDITSDFNKIGNSSVVNGVNQCLNNYFYVGKTDFRQTPKCQVNNYILLAFTIILCAVILVKFLAALQLSPKRRPSPQDKFVICQVPAYTEGEDQLRKSLDSLTALAYDNKRKLICVICDGMIVGGGNDRPTPKIVLDVLGVDPKTDPPALPFRSVGQGSEQLNYGKVYSGLYEYEGNVVPYIVVVKVGKESEQRKSKPGNRGKRDSQILLMSFLNRVHHRSPMSPLELEMFHQINNVIGVDPELYEYLFMVDADTMVMEDSLNRLVAHCANDAKIAGICGETSLENEEHSWWTMIQVYEYYISHHLAKAFESLFGSVTCLPGCFCMYRLRTADKGKPLIINDKVIEEYSDGNVDTLHKKNLLSLGEDRYLTTLMTKHFPSMSYKFVPHAHALTAAPDSFSVLLSQRRRWINSTIHNLAELVWLKDMCGFCCFSMRFVVFIDLFGTIILPATCAYLGYLIYTAASHQGQFPIVSIIMLAAVYGLQAIIFIIKRQWQHIGWMIIYIIAFPIYSFLLPVYSFWKQDDFSWGNTRIVIGEKGDKQVVAVEDEGFDPRSIPLQRWDDYATANNLPGRRGFVSEKGGMHSEVYEDGGMYEMDDMHSTYSSVKPTSAFHMGGAYGTERMSQHMGAAPMYGAGRQSVYSMHPSMQQQQHMSMPMSSAMSEAGFPTPMSQQQNPFNQSQNSRPSIPQYRSSVSSENLMNPHAYTPAGSSPNLLATPLPTSRGRSPLGMSAGSRPVSQVNFMEGPKTGPSDADIVNAIRECLREVDLDHVTKKQLKALAEQRLQTQLVGERKGFLDQMIDVELANM